MNESERKAVHELTNEELRREIAEALGYTTETHPQYKGWSRVIDPNGAPVSSDRNKNGWIPIEYLWGYDCLYPNWPGSIGAAFELAHQCKPDKAILRADYFGDVASVMYFNSDVPMPYVPKPLPRALSELAALALRQTGGAE